MKNLIIVRVGDDEPQHRTWLPSGPDKPFDVMVSYWGDHPERFADDGDWFIHHQGFFFPAMADLLDQHESLIFGYDAICLASDDIATDTGTLARMFAIFHEYGLSLAQPALHRDSHWVIRITAQDPTCLLRYTNFVETMIPVFTPAALRTCRVNFRDSPSGWGLDWVWTSLLGCPDDGIAIIDATPVSHTRPAHTSILYDKLRALGEDPWKNMADVCEKYGISAPSKHDLRVVRAVPLPHPDEPAHG